jgi:hypothetical protein
MNWELYISIAGALLTVDAIRNTVRYLQWKRTRSNMNSLFDEIEKTISDIKADSTETPRRRRTPLKPVNN